MMNCQTCIRSHVAGFVCPGKECQKCFNCGEGGHFKGAPVCMKLKPKKKSPDNKDSKKAPEKKT